MALQGALAAAPGGIFPWQAQWICGIAEPRGPTDCIEDVMNLWKALALAALAATLGVNASAQETQPTPAANAAPTTAQPEDFKDWKLYCPQPKAANDPRVCEARTVVLSKDGK